MKLRRRPPHHGTPYAAVPPPPDPPDRPYAPLGGMANTARALMLYEARLAGAGLDEAARVVDDVYGRRRDTPSTPRSLWAMLDDVRSMIVRRAP